jgi:hypothetical protein
MEGTASLVLPRRGRGRQTAAAEARYQAELEAFCEAILEIKSTILRSALVAGAMSWRMRPVYPRATLTKPKR